MVGAQVEPGTASDLEKPYRQTELVNKIQQTTDQCGGPTHLVGLRRLIEGGAQMVGVLGGGQRDIGPRRLGVPAPAGTRIPAAQRRRAAVEHQPVQPAEQSQRQRQPAGIVFVPGQNRREHAAGFDVGGHPLQHVAVHRRTQACANLTLHSNRPQQAAVVGTHVRDRSRSSSPARTTSKASPSACGSETDSSSSQCS